MTRNLSVTITGPEGMLEAMAKLLRDEGWTVVAPGTAGLPRFSLAKLKATMNRVTRVTADPASVRPLTAEDLAIIGYALGILSGERIAAGDRYEDEA